MMDRLGENNTLNSDGTFQVNREIMIVAVSVLFGVVLFIIALHLYAKWFWRSGDSRANDRVTRWRTRRMLEFAADFPDQNRTTQFDVGLDKSVVDKLPTFTFNDQSGSVNECAVCLEEFSQGEKGRLLPKCNHSFHTDCIDMWFLSHSTCPLCRCSVAPENSSSDIQQPPLEATSRGGGNHDGVGFHLSSGDIFVPISHGDCTSTNSSGDFRSGNHSNNNVHNQDARQASSAVPLPLVAVVEHRPGFVSVWDSSTLGAGPGLLSPRQQQQLQQQQQQQQQQQGSRPESPSSRRPSMSLSPKPSGIPYPANVLFWGNQTQMNVAGAVPGGPREDNGGGGGRRRSSSRGVHPLNSLVIEIPRSLPLESAAAPAQHHIGINILNSDDHPHRASDALGGAARPRSPIGRLVSSSFRRLLSIRRGPTSPTPGSTCSSTFDCEQQQQQDSTISSSASGATTIQISRTS